MAKPKQPTPIKKPTITIQQYNLPVRIPLSDGQWADVRRSNGGDIKAIALARHERGYDSETLDALILLERAITSWSLGVEISEATLDAMPEQDIVAAYAYSKLGVKPEK